MKAQNTLVRKDTQKQTFSSAITGASLQNLIKKSVPDAASAARFTGALISAVASNEQLKKCNPASVVAAALRGEGQGLSLGREYHLVPFGDSCAYVISYKGLISLALASGEVADMDCIPVKEGEYLGRDKRTKRPSFDFSVYETDEESDAHETIGYMAYVEMKDGYFRSEYMRVGEIVDHARRYSKSFDYEKYMKLERGEYTPQEAERVKSSSPWYGSFEVMAKKTVIRRLLNSGYVRLANSAAIREALAYDSASEEGIIPDLDLSVDASTGEVIETTATEVSDAQEGDNAPVEPQKEKTVKNTRKAKQADGLRENEPTAANDAQDLTDSFFGD